MLIVENARKDWKYECKHKELSLNFEKKDGIELQKWNSITDSE